MSWISFINKHSHNSEVIEYLTKINYMFVFYKCQSELQGIIYLV